MTYYYTSDHLRNTRELVNGSGSIVARYGYDAYGRTTLVSGSNIATFQYAGYYAHQPSGLYMTLFRPDYDPNLGRWLQRDPKGIDGGLNLYGYVDNNPDNESDPLGLCGVFLLVPSTRSDSTPVMTTNPNTSNLVSGPGYEVRFYDQGCCKGKITLVQTIDGRMDGSGPLPDAITQSASSGTPQPDGSGHYWFWDSPANGETLPIFRHSMEVCAICTCNGTPTVIGCVTFKWRAYNPVFNTGSLNKTGPSEPQPASPNFRKKGGL